MQYGDKSEPGSGHAVCLPPTLPVRDPAPAKRKPGRPRNEPIAEPVTAEAFLTSMQHFLPELPQWLNQVEDPRRRLDACTYSMQEITMLALVMLCCQCGSRRKLDRDRLREQFVLNFRMLLGNDEAEVTCADNMNRVLTMVDPANWSAWQFAAARR